MEFTKDIQFNMRPTVNKLVTITYHGFLSNSFELFIVYGFGESWENTSELKMQKTKNGFTAEINIPDFDTFNFCFRNSHFEWDNNYNCNYISPILPSIDEKVEALFQELLAPTKETSLSIKTFDMNALIEEILEPIMIKNSEKPTELTSIQITSNPIDLGLEITKALSQIENKSEKQELVEYSTLDEILTGTVIEQTPIELFEETIEESQELEQEKSLIPVESSFIISPRQLSKFYLFKKRLKLAFYKALVKIPKMIFGEENL